MRCQRHLTHLHFVCVSVRQAVALGHGYIGTEHLLLALLKEGEGTAAKVFENMKVDRERVRQEMLEAISDESKTEGDKAEPAAAAAGLAKAPQKPGTQGQEESSTLAGVRCKLCDFFFFFCGKSEQEKKWAFAFTAKKIHESKMFG